MAKGCEKVVVAMSGGVDSSVAACLLAERGYDVVGLFMRAGIVGGPDNQHAEASVGMAREKCGTGVQPVRGSAVSTPGRAHQGCCSASDAADARFVAGMLGIPFYALNFRDDFDEIIDYFADEYVSGRTPNPCVVCNDRLKFGRLLDYADAVGAKYVATGHYARIAKRDGRRVLCRGKDTGKDQSYVLFGLTPRVLDRVLFPVGELDKSQVRDIAARYGLPNRDKPDSVEICFVPDRDYARVVKERRPEAFAEGDVVDSQGNLVGRHRGIGHYTIGQRRGLGIAAGRPIYVTQLDAQSNRVTVGDDDDLLRSSLFANRANFLVDGLGDSFTAQVKIRYLHRAVPAIVHRLGRRRVRVVFDDPQRAITPGQAVVFYDGEVVLGGAWIERVEARAGANAAAHLVGRS